MVDFSSDRYTEILEAIKITYQHKLDFNSPPLEGDDFMDLPWISLGDDGNVFVFAFNDIYGSRTEAWQKAYREHVNFFTEPDGEVTAELSLYPLAPNFEYPEDVEEFYNSSRLNTLMTLEEFMDSLENEARWVYNCFGYRDIYEICFEIVPAGEVSKIKQWDRLLTSPLSVEYKNVKYDVFVYKYED